MENNLDPAKKQRREHLKQDLQDWISQQPELRVRLNEFREKVGRQSDFQSITSGRDFRIENDAAAEKWVYVGAARNHQPQSGQSKNQRRVQLRQLILNWLEKLPEQMATRQDLIREFGEETNQVLNDSSLVQFDYQDNYWCQTEKYYSSVFKAKLAEYRKRRLDAAWEKCANLCGDVARPGSSKAKSGRLFVVARTYTIESAAKRLGFTSTLMRDAVSCTYIESFIDPDGKIRIPATAAEQAANNAGTLEKIEGLTLLKCRQISLVAGFSYSTARSRLLKAHISPTAPKWYQIKGLWGLPQSLKEFQKILAERYPAWLASVINERNTYAPAMPSYEPRHEREHEYSGKDIVEQGIALARKEAELLRQQLIDIFPTWDHTRNADPRVTLHIGPTNSGKTFTGLSSLESAGSGWYLSPLRLLAHEVFETLNARGVRCNLLTGEERIDVEGALITASTIEMFNPHRSGACVVIDEAHMLADEQRGWAWTRAIMEARAPEMHIAGSPIAETLVRRLVEELGFSVEIERYERMTPLTVAENVWTLESLPPRTILVAFSRRMVLALKTDLESKFNRKVSVIYGNLPPEVRLRQADRFASGETEVCVATDAIGMGLNLPADHVCFFETEKFDGTSVRPLKTNEIKQIGGRAGRYGLSEQGVVGAVTKFALNTVRQAMQAKNISIGYAYIAPTPESIALLPGSLGMKLSRWGKLKGIPEKWRNLLKPVDLTEQIILASMLSPKSVEKIGEATALHLINAPCVKNTEPYWLTCAKAIIAEKGMPLPLGELKSRILNSHDLELCEMAIRCADIYLWLAQRKEFAPYAPEEDFVRRNRAHLSTILDEALVSQIDTARRCGTCGRLLPIRHRYNICERCYNDRRSEYEYY